MAKKGKTPTFNSKLNVVEVLKELDSGVHRSVAPKSYYLMRQLADLGYVDYGPGATKGPRGRTPKVFTVSGKGRSLIALAPQWKRKA